MYVTVLKDKTKMFYRPTSILKDKTKMCYVIVNAFCAGVWFSWASVCMAH